jgi:polyisoprenyl-phosphate glycosyltransferase
MSAAQLVVVTPVFEDREAARRLFSELAACLGAGVFIVAVDDGSCVDPPLAGDIAAAGVDGVVISLNRNVGHQRAIAVGLDYVSRHLPRAERVIVMDSDGEDVPATIPILLQQLDERQVDVMVAQRRHRVESFRFKIFYAIYKALFWLLTGRRISFGNYMAMTGAAARRLASMGELGMHVAGSVLVSRLRWRPCPLDRGARYAGRSKMNFVGLVLHGMRALMVFAEDVLVRVGATCLIVASASLLGALLAIVLKSIGYATPGWFSVALGILLLMFLQTGAIALMTLLLSGIARNATVIPLDYRRLIQAVTASRASVGDA